ncbi:SIMPL domain-containing protein [Pseudoalteromonas denitrificans]|uniref:SIMPL domain-containing protein n=1 Tax=Pseudoalteromonas denitrificans DSM 6059 TaxID=1123010 RepID=A0A1I1ECF2_9GAMM|nr:SIMPL domain-containing protein [Pseudoalteromonas denitrificans]SFB82650.1 hypothetical protein SAMN02745724_00243 [Pseudoalteromonas denitrificans DSM 6059]
MIQTSRLNSIVIGISLVIGLIGLGLSIKSGLLAFKSLERSVIVKGLAEQVVDADTVIWPIKFSDAGNDLASLITSVQEKNTSVIAFLKLHGFDDDEITIGTQTVHDKLATEYSNNQGFKFRYTVESSLSVYSHSTAKVLNASSKMSELAKQNIVMLRQDYNNRLEFLFTKLNDIKPQMVQTATQKAREVAQKFASDSKSKLGKIKSAKQGQFTISDRDSNTPHIKKVRVVSTIEYYLSD